MKDLKTLYLEEKCQEKHNYVHFQIPQNEKFPNKVIFYSKLFLSRLLRVTVGIWRAAPVTTTAFKHFLNFPSRKILFLHAVFLTFTRIFVWFWLIRKGRVPINIVAFFLVSTLYVALSISNFTNFFPYYIFRIHPRFSISQNCKDSWTEKCFELFKRGGV